jgi:hypothetical protein
LDGFEAYDLDETRADTKRARWRETVRAFLASGNRCMGRKYDDMGELNRDRCTARAACKEVGGARVSRRGNVLLLVREVD